MFTETNKENVTFKSEVLSNYKSSLSNKLYKVEDSFKSSNPFLLFNHGIHYWVALDKLGTEIIRALNKNKNLSELKNELLLKGVIDSEKLENEVIPILKFLIKLNFIQTDNLDKERNWGKKVFPLNTPIQYPFEDIVISLADQCNLACKYCFNAGSRHSRINKNSRIKKIDRKSIKKLLISYQKAGGTGVIFTGGEPTLNPELLSFLEDAKACGLKTSLITNGTRLKDLQIDKLVTVLDSLHVSIDSLDPEINSKLWGIKVEKIREDFISELVKIGSKASQIGEKIRLVLKPTITRLNQHLLSDLFIECGKRLSQFDFDFDITKYEPIENKEVNAELEISPKEYKNSLYSAFKAYLQNLNPDITEIDAHYKAELFAHTNAGKVTPSNRPVNLSCVPSLFVTNNGDVYPCQAFEVAHFKLGNVFEHSINDFFTHKGFSILRTKMTRDDIEICKDCEFRFLCTDHCHGESFKKIGKTTAFRGDKTFDCKKRVVKRLWLETQVKK